MTVCRWDLRQLGVEAGYSARRATFVAAAKGVSWPEAVAQVNAVGEKLVLVTVFVAIEVTWVELVIVRVYLKFAIDGQQASQKCRTMQHGIDNRLLVSPLE